MSQLFTSDGQSTGVSASTSVLPMNIQDWYSFRMDWLDLLPVQGTLKSLLQHHSSKASILRDLAFFIVQLLHPYMTTGKTIALTRRTFVVKVMSLLFNMLSRLVIIFLSRSKHLFISWLQWFKMPKECSNYRTIALISHASKVMLKILQARLQQYVNCKFPNIQAGFRKDRGTRDQIANLHWIIDKAKEFQKKNLFLLYWLCQSLWLCGLPQTVKNS